MHLLGMLGGTLSCYLLGTVWLMIQAGLDIYSAFFAGVVPFVLGDVAKIVVVLFVGPIVRKQLKQAGLN